MWVAHASRVLVAVSRRNELTKINELGCNGCEATARLSNQEVRKIL